MFKLKVASERDSIFNPFIYTLDQGINCFMDSLFET